MGIVTAAGKQAFKIKICTVTPSSLKGWKTERGAVYYLKMGRNHQVIIGKRLWGIAKRTLNDVLDAEKEVMEFLKRNLKIDRYLYGSKDGHRAWVNIEELQKSGLSQIARSVFEEGAIGTNRANTAFFIDLPPYVHSSERRVIREVVNSVIDAFSKQMAERLDRRLRRGRKYQVEDEFIGAMKSELKLFDIRYITDLLFPGHDMRVPADNGPVWYNRGINRGIPQL